MIFDVWRICVNLNIGLLNPAVVIFVYTLIPPGAVNVCVCTLPPEEQSSTSMCAVQGTEPNWCMALHMQNPLAQVPGASS